MQHRLCRAMAMLALLTLCAGPALAERFRIPGTGITIDAPAGFVLSERFPGVQHDATQSSILVNEIPAPVSSMTAGFTAENLATRGMTLESSEQVSISGRPAVLYNLTQSAGGIVFEKWIAATGDDRSAVLIVATYPRVVAGSISAPMRDAVLSTLLESRAARDHFEGLRYRITAPAGLEVQHRIQNMLLLGTPDAARDPGPSQPIAVVGSSYAPVAIDDIPTFSRERITRTAQITGIIDIQGTPRQIAGRSAYEITARASDKDTGAPLVVYQMVVVDGADYYITQGMVGEEGAAIYMPKFRAVAESMTIR